MPNCARRHARRLWWRDAAEQDVWFRGLDLRDGDSHFIMQPRPLNYVCQPASCSIYTSAILTYYLLVVKQGGVEFNLFEPLAQEVAVARTSNTLVGPISSVRGPLSASSRA